MYKTVLLLIIVFLSGCLTQTENISVPSVESKQESGTARRVGGDKYYLPNQFDCYQPGVMSSSSDGVKRPAKFPQFNSDYRCMVCNCVHEAGTSNRKSQVEVLKTVFMRIWDKSFPRWPGYSNDECGIIYENKQYSWTWGKRGFTKDGREINGKQDKRGQILSRSELEVKSCEAAVQDTYENRSRELGTTHYVNKSIANPSWLRRCRNPITIGSHTHCHGLIGESRPPRVPGAPIEASPVHTTIAKILRGLGYDI